MATIREVAAAAGVSKTTVSAVIRNEPHVAEATRRQVQAAIKRLDYRPNPMVTSLMSNLRQSRSRVDRTIIAWLYDNPPGAAGAVLEKQLHDAAQDRADQLGFKLERFDYGAGQMTGRRLSSVLLHRGIRAVIVSPPPHHGQRIDLEWDHFAGSTIGYTLAHPVLNRVQIDHYHGALWLFRYLRNLGYRRIGLALPARVELRHHSIFKAVFAMYREELPPAERVRNHLPDEWSERAFLVWYRREKPDAIVSINLDVLDWLGRDGVSVPADVGVATVYHGATRGTLSGLTLNIAASAAGAVDLVAGHLYRNEYGLPELPKTIILPPMWQQGTTLRAPASATVDFGWVAGESYPLPGRHLLLEA
jgi:DNA-binding LacI/PurR family transcriptional regulator